MNPDITSIRQLRGYGPGSLVEDRHGLRLMRTHKGWTCQNGSRDLADERVFDEGGPLTLVSAEKADPSPDLSLIPSSREEARVLEVNGALGTYWRAQDRVLRTSAHSPQSLACWVDEVTSVREVRVLADDEVAVPRELIERAKAWSHDYPDRGRENFSSTIIRDLAALGGGDSDA